MIYRLISIREISVLLPGKVVRKDQGDHISGQILIPVSALVVIGNLPIILRVLIEEVNDVVEEFHANVGLLQLYGEL